MENRGLDDLGRRQHRDARRIRFAEKASGYKRKTLQEWAYVARHSSMRMEDLSFNHHQDVAALLPDAQKRCLEHASAQKLSARDLREMARWQPRRLEINPDEAKEEASLLLRFQCRREFDILEIQARQMGFISDEDNSAVGRLVRHLIVEHVKAHADAGKIANAKFEKAR